MSIAFNENNRDIVVYADTLDSGSEGMLRAICNSPSTEGSKIRIMPDMHNGKGCVIGTTMTITDKVVPNFVGVDIGCGVYGIKFYAKHLDFRKLDVLIRERIPAGPKIRKDPHRFVSTLNLDRLHCAKHVQIDKALCSISTLGGGNHFIEVDQDDAGAYWLIVHSGSRHLGAEVAEWYQDQAFKNCPEGTPYDLAWLEGDLMQSYLHDMGIVQDFASTNRRAIVNEILNGMKLDAEDAVSSIHNYIDLDNMILRKGAISANLSERIIIPLNMRDGCLICAGKGNPDWNYSAPHGAGRLLSRKEAKESLTLSEYKKQMEGIYSTSISRKTIDESPMAYKPLYTILPHLEKTAYVIEKTTPVYNFKSSK